MWRSSASTDFADTTHGTTEGDRAGSVPATVPSSMITCALVPLMPKADTAARRGRSTSGQSTFSVTSSRAPADQSTWVLGLSRCRILGTMPCRIACTILITPATPAAACVCPIFDFNAPNNTGTSRP